MRPLALFFFSILLALPVFAQNNEVAVSYGRINTQSQGNAPALGVSYARFWTRSVATRIGGFTGSETLNSDGGEKELRALYATAEYHFFRGRPVSAHLAGGGAYFTNRVETAIFVTEKTDSQFTTAVGGGVDLNFSPRVAFGVEALYMPFQWNEDGDRFQVKLDPLTILGSVRYRW